jgi:signal peptidase I
MLFLTPRHVKQGREMAKDARKMLAYKRDLWSAEETSRFQAAIEDLERENSGANREKIEAAALKLDQLAGNQVKQPSQAGWREHCEVVLVAIAVALGVRTYFLQPFTIPTGSMQPTLNGVIGYKTTKAPPNFLIQLLQEAAWGRTWVNVVADQDDTITDVRESKWLGIFTVTTLEGNHSRYRVRCPKETLLRYLINPWQPFKSGEVIARGYFETGDHVFVDMISYHFRRPERGEVFVFNTQNIPTRDNLSSMMQGPSQFYIKRLAGTPGDTLQIRPPQLFVNGKPAEGHGFERVMSEKDGYRGYSNESEQTDPSGRIQRYKMTYLKTPSEHFSLDSKAAGANENQYFALGDNSFHSSDGRDWGVVPERNLVGRGLLVYWPFTRHWGLIR